MENPQPYGPVDVEITFKDGSLPRLLEDVQVSEGLTALTVYTAPGEKAVVPLVNILFYEVSEVVK